MTSTRRSVVHACRLSSRSSAKFMSRAELFEPHRPLKITSLPIPKAPDGGILLKTLYTRICRLDVDIQQGYGYTILGSGYKGLVMGQEFSGEVLDLGYGVPQDQCSIKIGDTVVIYPWRGCRKCDFCRAGQTNLCDANKTGFGTDIGLSPRNPGGYASHVQLANWDLAVKLPSKVPPEVGCTLPSSALTAYAAILKARPALEGGLRTRGSAKLLILGTGGLGLWGLVLAKSLFHAQNVQVTMADSSQLKLEACRLAGADAIVTWDRDTNEKDALYAMTRASGGKIDAAIDFIGTSFTVPTVSRCLHHSGTLVVTGFLGDNMTLPVGAVVTKAISIQGSRAGTMEQLKELVELVSTEGLSHPLPMEYYPLEEVNDVLGRMRHGNMKGTAVLYFDEERHHKK